MTRPEQIEFDRLRFWQGQRLKAGDFRDQATIAAQLRWWHNRALHNTFGVRYGFQTALVLRADVPEAVEVSCGLAYDCFGRELILQTTREIPLPVMNELTVNGMTLVVSYKQTNQFTARSQAHAASIESPGMAWMPAAKLTAEDGVGIARLVYQSTADLENLPEKVEFSRPLSRRVSYDAEKKLLIFNGRMTEAERDQLLELAQDSLYRQAVEALFNSPQLRPTLDPDFTILQSRPMARPRIGSGNTTPGHTAWEIWSERVISGRRTIEMPIGVQVTIDTSAAGFTEAPCYFAWLQGPLWDQANIEFFPAPFTHIDQDSVTPKRFRFRLWMPNMLMILGSRIRLANQQFATEFLNFAQSKNLHVCWLGIQHMPEIGCEPPAGCACHTED